MPRFCCVLVCHGLGNRQTNPQKSHNHYINYYHLPFLPPFLPFLDLLHTHTIPSSPFISRNPCFTLFGIRYVTVGSLELRQGQDQRPLLLRQFARHPNLGKSDLVNE